MTPANPDSVSATRSGNDALADLTQPAVLDAGLKRAPGDPDRTGRMPCALALHAVDNATAMRSLLNKVFAKTDLAAQNLDSARGVLDRADIERQTGFWLQAAECH